MHAVNPAYTMTSFAVSDYQFVATLRRQVVGVLLARQLNNAVYVLLVCSVSGGVGTVLMRKVEQFAKSNESAQVQLDAVLSAASFYDRLGYQRGSPGEKVVIENRSVMQGFLDLFRRRQKKRVAEPECVFMYKTV
jgi:hypothetical protein